MIESIRFRVAALLGLAALGGAPRALAAQDFVLVAHPALAVDTVDRGTMQRVFLKEAVRLGGARVRPVDQALDAPVRAAFSKRVVRRPVGEMRGYWQQRIWAGGDLPPETMTSDREVLKYVATTPGAIGYVSADAPLDGLPVKVLTLR